MTSPQRTVDVAESGPKPVRRRRPLATLKQVAERAGVSIATASYVVSGRPRALSANAVRRVWDAVNELGYVPQASGRQLQGLGTRTLGLIFPHEVTSLGTSSYFGQILDGVLDVATEHRYNVMLFTGSTWYRAEHGYGVYVDGRCDGHLLIAPSTAPQLVGQILRHGVPVVVVGAVSPVTGVASFTSENAEAIESAVRYLFDLGHTRIAFLAGNPNATESQEREEGYRAGMTARGLTPRPEWLFSGDFHRIGGLAAVDYWIQLPSSVRPTAVVCANDEMASGVLECLVRHGLQAPQDFSVIGFDDLEATDPPLTTFQQQLREMGRQATECLISQVEGRDSLTGVVRLPAPFIPRASCAAAPQSDLRTLVPVVDGDLNP